MGMVIGIAPERIAHYKQLHAEVWPQVLATLKAANVRIPRRRY
jgi:L-rhamnose mutarotase